MMHPVVNRWGGGGAHQRPLPLPSHFLPRSARSGGLEGRSISRNLSGGSDSLRRRRARPRAGGSTIFSFPSHPYSFPKILRAPVLQQSDEPAGVRSIEGARPLADQCGLWGTMRTVAPPLECATKWRFFRNSFSILSTQVRRGVVRGLDARPEREDKETFPAANEFSISTRRSTRSRRSSSRKPVLLRGAGPQAADDRPEPELARRRGRDPGLADPLQAHDRVAREPPARVQDPEPGEAADVGIVDLDV